jgi:large subunit ribosomal protein L6
MSRIGKKPVTIPAGVEVGVQGQRVTVKGPKGALELELTGAVSAAVDPQAHELRVLRHNDERTDRAKHGLYRSLLANMVLGVTKGYERRLEIQGVGYKAQVAGSRLQLFVGFNNKVPSTFAVPAGVSVVCPSPTQIVISGIDKQLVGQVAAEIRSIHPPDVYHGKGIRYQGEAVRKLPGKTVGATTTGTK